MWRGWRVWALFLLAPIILLLIMDSCMQFRMSKKEINQYFSEKQVNGTLHSYQVGSRTINYVESGQMDGPLVVFVHGSPGSLSSFIDFMADKALTTRAHLIAVDRPGFGHSNFGHAETSLNKQSLLLKPILETHKMKRPIILVGHSLGGPLIARMAMDYPELIDGIILVAPSIDPNLEPDEWFRGPLAMPFLRWLLPRSIRASNDEIYKLKPELEEMLPRWKEIRVQTTVIQGCNDNLVDPRNADFAQKRISGTNVRMIAVENMNHFVPWKNPELIRMAILEQLKLLPL